MQNPLFDGFNKVHKRYLLKLCTLVSLSSMCILSVKACLLTLLIVSLLRRYVAVYQELHFYSALLLLLHYCKIAVLAT